MALKTTVEGLKQPNMPLPGIARHSDFLAVLHAISRAAEAASGTRPAFPIAELWPESIALAVSRSVMLVAEEEIIQFGMKTGTRVVARDPESFGRHLRAQGLTAIQVVFEQGEEGIHLEASRDSHIPPFHIATSFHDDTTDIWNVSIERKQQLHLPARLLGSWRDGATSDMAASVEPITIRLVRHHTIDLRNQPMTITAIKTALLGLVAQDGMLKEVAPDIVLTPPEHIRIPEDLLAATNERWIFGTEGPFGIDAPAEITARFCAAATEHYHACLEMLGMICVLPSIPAGEQHESLHPAASILTRTTEGRMREQSQEPATEKVESPIVTPAKAPRIKPGQRDDIRLLIGTGLAYLFLAVGIILGIQPIVLETSRNAELPVKLSSLSLVFVGLVRILLGTGALLVAMQKKDAEGGTASFADDSRRIITIALSARTVVPATWPVPIIVATLPTIRHGADASALALWSLFLMFAIIVVDATARRTRRRGQGQQNIRE